MKFKHNTHGRAIVIIAGIMLLVAILTVAVVMIISNIENNDEWVVSGKMPDERQIAACDAMMPECGVCGYGYKESDSKVENGYCYIRKSALDERNMK